MKVSSKWALLIIAFVLSGCAGPATRVLPRVEESDKPVEMPAETDVMEEVNPFYLQEEVNTLAASPRPAGSPEEMAASIYMEGLLTDYGYKVKTQPFQEEFSEGIVSGRNVVAVREADRNFNSESDILLILTHHDSSPMSLGANYNASGAAAFLETARFLSKLPTDTELRLVSTCESGNENLGSTVYLNSLTKREKERIVGVINLEPMGHISHPDIILYTADGNQTMLSEMLAQSADHILRELWKEEATESSTELLYAYHQIPVVTISQNGYAYEEGTLLDEPQIVDIERISQVVDVVCYTAAQIMNETTPSLMAKAHSMTDLRRYGFWQRKETPSLFGADLRTVERTFGMQGIAAATNTDSAGRQIEKYQFLMKWFGVDQLILTDYYFIDGKLSFISLEADAAGVDFQDMKQRLESWYGEPAGANQGPSGTEYDWADGVNGKFLALIPRTNGYALEIREYSMETVLYEERTPDGIILMQNKEDDRCKEIMSIFQIVFPEEIRQQMGQIRFYSDGMGDSTMNFSAGDAGNYQLSVDVEDALPIAGGKAGRAKLIQDFLECYGELLSQEEYRTAFANQFPVSEFEESFALFVLCGAPGKDTGEWGERINFFYAFEPLVQYRETVRSRLQ